MNTIKTDFKAPRSTARLRGLAIVFTLLSGLFILAGCGNLANLATLLKGGFDPTDCNINPFQEKCYTIVTAEDVVEDVVNLNDDELAALSPEELAARNEKIRLRKEQEAKRQAELDALAARRKELIDPVVAECAVNSVAEHCRNAFVWCSDFENTNSLECENAVGADTGLFACLTDPYRDECANQPALQETISGEVPVIDEETGDVKLDEETGEEVTEVKEVNLLENTIQARINYCRSDNDAGVPNIEANPVLCDSTVREVCSDPANPSGVFDVFCIDDPESGETPYEDERLRIVTGCNDESLSGVAQGCTSVVDFCNNSPFGNARCNIPAFATARATRVELCINARTTAESNECGVELANNPCFGDPFTDSVDCADDLNLGSEANVKTAQQSRSVLCVNAFIAQAYPEVCGSATAQSCVTNPFGDCEEQLGVEGQVIAQQTRAQYCVIGDSSADPLCTGANANACITDPTGTNCVAFFGTTQAQTNAQTQRTNYCNVLVAAGGATAIEGDTLCDKIVENACALNPFAKSAVSPNCLDKPNLATARRTFVNECRSGTRTEGCNFNNITTCNENPFGPYADNRCIATHFNDARADYKRLVITCRGNPNSSGCDTQGAYINSCNSAPFAGYTIGGVPTDICGFDHFDDARDAYCQENPFFRVTQCEGGKYAPDRLEFVNDCRSGARTVGCGEDDELIKACNRDPFSIGYQGDPCAPDHFDGARLDFVNNCRENDQLPNCDGRINTCIGNPFVVHTRNTATLLCDDPAYDDTKKLRVAFCNDDTNSGHANCTGNSVEGICLYDPFAEVCLGEDSYNGARTTKITNCSVRADSDTGACATALKRPTAASWLKSFATPLRTTATADNQFLAGTASGLSTTATVTTLKITNDLKNGVGFFTANDRFYAGLFSGVNLGAPLDDGLQAGTWSGSLHAVVGSTLGTATSMTLHVVYADGGNTRVINAFVPVSGNNHFLLDGTFTANGVISGTVNYGVFTGGVEDTPAGGRGTNGILTGLIGVNGALGAFHSTATGTDGYAGGFVATKP